MPEIYETNDLISIPNAVGARGERMFWLGETPRLWAMAHLPTTTSGAVIQPRRAVVLCSPFAEEEKCSRRLYVELSRQLAQHGIASVRFSYRGTGDSEGEFPDFNVDSADTDVCRVLDWTRQTMGQIPITLLGLRLGSIFALRSAAEPGVDSAVLWAPVVNGRSYVRMNFRRKAIREMINTGQNSVDLNSPQQKVITPNESIFDFDGYAVDRLLWDQMEALRCDPPPEWKGSALIVSVGATNHPTSEASALTERLLASSVRAEINTVVSQPFWNLLGLVDCPEIIARTAGWIESV